MDIYKIAAAGHTPNGTWCSCGELAKDCWFNAIYHPYTDLCGQASYDRLFGIPEVDMDALETWMDEIERA